MSKARILVIEDETTIQNVVRAYLAGAGYDVRCVGDGALGLLEAGAFQPDLVVLDINLPGMNGLDVATQLRRRSDVPIVMLTARGEEEDRIRGLTLGADDYIAKPFSPRELVARVEAVLRRARPGSSGSAGGASDAPPANVLRFRHVTVDLDSHTASTPHGELTLTTTEFHLLVELMQHAGRVLTRRQLLDRVWGSAFAGNDRVVDVYVGQVRRKLELLEPDAALIATVRGVGYRFTDERL